MPGFVFGALRARLDCFAEPVIGPAFGRTRWLAMTLRDDAEG